MINDNILNMKQKVNIQILIKNYGIILVLLLSFWTIKPFFIPGFFPMHDDTQVARVFEMGKMLSKGVFLVRWVPDLGYGYGYPIFNFYAPLAYYFGGFINLLGFDALIATKIMIIVGILLSGVFMYLLAKEFWGKVGGVLSGLFYVYAPYHALDIYVRGDVAEFWAYAFIPLMFYGLYKVFDSPRRSPSVTSEVGSCWKWILVGSLGYAGVILSHNLTAMMITPFLLIAILLNCYIVPKGKKLLILYHSSLILFLGLAVSAFYWIPALVEMKNTNVLSQIGGGADFRDHFVCLSQLWDSAWGFGGSTKGCIDGMSFTIGKLHVIGSLIALVLMFLMMKNKSYNNYKYYILFAFAGLVISIFFTLEASKFLWQTIPQMAFFQYPWRFLILASFFSSFIAGSVAYLLTQFKIRPYLTAIVLIFLLLLFNIKLFNPQTILSKTAEDYTNERALKWVASKTSDEFLPPDFNKPKSEREIAKSPAIQPKETALEKVSNIISLISVLSLIAGIILTRKRGLKSSKT